MKRTICFLVILLLTGVVAFAQTRSDILVYIPPVVAQDPDQAVYFQNNFEMETEGAGYALTDGPEGADYILNLTVKPNMVMYDDGTMDRAPPDEKQYVLDITLVRSEDDIEVVSFSFIFNDTEEMFDYNLYLLYEAMANVPFTKLGDIPIIYVDENWRNKWLYVRVSVDYPITFYGLIPDSKYGAALWDKEYPMPSNAKSYRLDNIISPWLAATVGVEFQYLNWMSTEVNFNLSFGDPMSNAFIATLQAEQKFSIKPSGAKHLLIQPYGAAAFPTNTSSKALAFPWLGVGGGLQLGMKGGSSGALFFDVNFIYYLGNVVEENTNKPYEWPRDINYYRYVVGIGFGYKIGFVDRPKRK